MITPRPDQDEIITDVRQVIRRVNSVLLQGPCGIGKTAMVSIILDGAKAKGTRSFFIIHRELLLKQVAKALDKAGIEYGIIAAGHKPDYTKDVQICMIQTLNNRLGIVKKPNLLIWDEAHFCLASSYKKVKAHYFDAKHIGLSASPERLSGEGLIEFFDEMVKSPSVEWYIKNEILSPYKLYRPSSTDMSGVKTVRGDYDTQQMGAIIDKSTIVGDAIIHWRRLCLGKRAVVFCHNVAHSKRTCNEFNDAGIPAAHMDAKTPSKERDIIVEKFEKGEILILCNVDIVSCGFDLPAIEAVILLRPTKSIALHTQQIGRAMRKWPGKSHAIILDHANNTKIFGLPDQDYEWSLEGRKKKKQSERVTPTRTCDICYCVVPAAQSICPECGHQFEIKERKIKHVDGSLEEVNIEEARKNRLELFANAHTLKDHQEVAKKLNYKIGYGYYVWKRKQERKRSSGGNSPDV